MRRIAVLASLALVGGCKLTSIYMQGPPRRVRIEKQTTEPLVLAEGVRDAGGGVVVRVLELRELRVTRRTQHAALEIRVEHPGHPFWELLEVPIGLAMALSLPASLAWDVSDMAGNKAGIQREPLRPVVAMLNPFRSMSGGKPRVYVADQVSFESAPRMRQYNVRLPLAALPLRYRVLDAGRAALSSGELETDQFGTVRIPDVPAQAVGIELVGERVHLIAPLAGPAPAAEPAP
jgi:hypothetical protein